MLRYYAIVTDSFGTFNLRFHSTAVAAIAEALSFGYEQFRIECFVEKVH